MDELNFRTIQSYTSGTTLFLQQLQKDPEVLSELFVSRKTLSKRGRCTSLRFPEASLHLHNVGISARRSKDFIIEWGNNMQCKHYVRRLTEARCCISLSSFEVLPIMAVAAVVSFREHLMHRWADAWTSSPHSIQCFER